MAPDWLEELRERLFGASFQPELESRVRALIRPVPPFDGSGSTLVAFGSLVLLIGSIAVGLVSFAGLLAALAAVYLIVVRVFGIRFDLPEAQAFGL